MVGIKTVCLFPEEPLKDHVGALSNAPVGVFCFLSASGGAAGRKKEHFPHKILLTRDGSCQVFGPCWDGFDEKSLSQSLSKGFIHDSSISSPV